MSFKSVFERNPICILDKRHRRENWESSNGLFDWLKQMLLDFRLVETFFENIKAFRSYDKFNTTTWKNGSMRVRPLVVLYSIFFIFFFRTHLAPVVLIIYWQRALSIIEFSLFNIHNNLLSSSKLLMFWEINVIWSLSSALSSVNFTHLKW